MFPLFDSPGVLPKSSHFLVKTPVNQKAGIWYYAKIIKPNSLPGCEIWIIQMSFIHFWIWKNLSFLLFPKSKINKRHKCWYKRNGTPLADLEGLRGCIVKKKKKRERDFHWYIVKFIFHKLSYMYFLVLWIAYTVQTSEGIFQRNVF